MFGAYNSAPVNAYPRAAPSSTTGGGTTVNLHGGLVTGGLGTRRGLVTRGIRGGRATGIPVVPQLGKGFVVLKEIKRMLVSAGIVPDTRIFISLDREPEASPTYNFLVINPGPMRIRESRYAGGGRKVSSVDSFVNIQVVTQSSLDRAPSDEIRLIEATNGALSIVHRVIDALHEKFVADSGGAILTDEAMQFTTQATPVRYRDQARWVRTELTFAFTYTLSLSEVTP